MKMKKYRATQEFTYDKLYKVGDEITPDEAEARNLILSGLIEPIEPEAPEAPEVQNETNTKKRQTQADRP